MSTQFTNVMTIVKALSEVGETEEPERYYGQTSRVRLVGKLVEQGPSMRAFGESDVRFTARRSELRRIWLSERVGVVYMLRRGVLFSFVRRLPFSS
jgi:hypothetical protein